MSKPIPWKLVFAVGFIVGFALVATGAITFDPGEAGQVSDGVSLGAPDGMNVTLYGDTKMSGEPSDTFPSSNTVQLITEDGNITFASNGPAWAAVDKDNITGTYTNITEIDATSNDITINPEGKRKITVGKDIDRIDFRDATVNDGNVDFVYAGSSGTSKVILFDVQADTQIGAVDFEAGEMLDVGTSDANGVLTLSDLKNSEHTASLTTTDGGPTVSNSSPNDQTFRTETVTLSADISDPDFPEDEITLEWYVDGTVENTTTITSAGTATANVTLPDGQYDWHVEATDAYGQTDVGATKTFTINHYNPSVSDIEPSGDLDSNPTQISANVSDDDFGVDGDTLTVNISLDGSQIDSQTVTSDSTVTTSMPSSGQTGGQHDIVINVTDSYDQSVVGTQSYSVPDTLFIRNETDYEDLVPANGEVRFIADNEIYTRTSSDGKIDLTSLPVNQDFIVEIEPTESNYTDRTIYIQTIYEQQNAFVLNTSAYDTIETRFRLNDPTAEYGPESVLQIQRGINQSGSVTYQTVKADKFGVEGVTATLQADQRYQLKITGEPGEQAVGTYRSDVSETVEVEPGPPGVNTTGNGQGYAYNAVLNNRTLELAYDDPTGSTDKLVVWIHERGDKDNKLQPNQTAIDLGSFSDTVTLTENESEKEWVVEFIISQGSNDTVATVTVANQQNLTPPVDSGWRLMIGIAMLILFAGTFSVLNAAAGAVAVSLVGGLLWWTGWLGSATTGAAVAIAIFLSVAAYMYKGAF